MKTPFVILHGWGASAKSYERLKPLLEQKGISVFVFDLPGFGNEPAPKSAWSVSDYVEWVNMKVKEDLDSCLRRNDKKESENDEKEGGGVNNINKIVLFGHSFGGRIAIKFAAKYPEKLAGLILCDAAGITPRPKAKIAIFSLLSKTGKIIFSLPILKYFQPIVRRIEYFLSGSRDYYYLQNPIMKKVFNNVINEDLAEHLKKVTAPTLIVWGKNDKMTPVSDAYVMHEKIKGSKLEILEGTGHSPHLESPEVLADKIYNFLGELDVNN
jgi:pimeloyl-ACP methyl ester carboxylesterase